jgi:hypothetical protein
MRLGNAARALDFAALTQASHLLLALRSRGYGRGVEWVGMDTHCSAGKLGQLPDE